MIGNDYYKSEYDNYVFHKKLLDGSLIYLLLYVDDILIVYKKMFKINKLKTWLKVEFEMKNLKVMKKILGMEFHREQEVEKLYLPQKKYI